MDPWNHYPTEEPEQTTNGGEEPAHAQPPEPVTPPTQQAPYSSYGWNQTPPMPPRPPRKKSGAGVAVAIISVACVAVIAALSVLLVLAVRENGLPTLPNNGQSSDAHTSQNQNAPKLEITELDETTQGLSSRDIVERNLDSTVLLTMYTTTATNSNRPFGQSGTAQEVKAGSASGIVLTADGYIITNGHCVVNESTNQPFSRVEVTLYDGTVYKNAKVIGADTSTDLAVIKVDATNLKPAEFGDSTAMQLGDRVVALGNAGGLGFSATQGILSGLARDVYDDTGYAIQCFQVDAAINPGNSGGPLFNAAGQVIAVNSAKIVADGYEGLGFSIPINEAKKIIDELIQNGYVTGRVALGIEGNSYADAYYKGFLIYSINEDSPLRGTGVQKGDLITAVNDTEVTDYSTLRAALAKNKVGDVVTLTLLRADGRQVNSYKVEVKLAEAKE